jgi:hypothetical protein
VGSAVKDPDDLTIALYGHPGNGSIRAEFDVFDSHLLGEFTATRSEALLQFGV